MNLHWKTVRHVIPSFTAKSADTDSNENAPSPSIRSCCRDPSWPGKEEESGFQVGQAFACSCLPAEHFHIKFSLTVGAQERLKVLCRVRLVLAEEFD